jgi:3'-phosphoadenosine 5'-phosphosulfate (PAPS) 3'-phosphatase
MPLPDLDDALSAAMRTVDLAVIHVLRHQPTRITSKGDRDLVTNIDLAVEAQIRDGLHDWDPESASSARKTAPSATRTPAGRSTRSMSMIVRRGVDDPFALRRPATG